MRSEEGKGKKKRKIAEENKKFVCPVEGCNSGEGGTAKRCANPAALKNHVRFKHPEKFAALYPTTPKEGGAEGKSFRKKRRGSEGKKDKNGSGNAEGEGDASWGGWVPL